MDERRVKDKKRGAVLIITFMVITMLVIISVGMFLRMLSESRSSERHRDAAVAFYLAEAAVDSAIAQLPANLAPATGVLLGTGNGIGRYSFTITPLVAGSEWEITGTGYVPDVAPVRAQKTIKAVVAKIDLADFFWNNAITSSGPVDFDGAKATTVTNDEPDAPPLEFHDVLSGHDITDPWDGASPDRIKEDDSNLSKDLPLLDFTSLLGEPGGAEEHSAYWQQEHDPNGYTHVTSGYDSNMPPTFWFDKPDPADPTTWIPNIVYINGDLALPKGGAGAKNMGGFIIVGGNVIQNVDLSGNVIVDGCIYTRGKFEFTGGGGVSNILGGVWAGNAGCNIGGSVTITYNKTYMDAIRYKLEPSTVVQLISWREE